MSTITDKPKYDTGVPMKVYVTSGELTWCGIASGPLDAIKKALEIASGKTLDTDYFFIDQRGFRTEDAEFKVPISRGLKHAGWVYDDPSSADD